MVSSRDASQNSVRCYAECWSKALIFNISVWYLHRAIAGREFCHDAGNCDIERLARVAFYSNQPYEKAGAISYVLNRRARRDAPCLLGK